MEAHEVTTNAAPTSSSELELRRQVATNAHSLASVEARRADLEPEDIHRASMRLGVQIGFCLAQNELQLTPAGSSSNTYSDPSTLSSGSRENTPSGRAA